MLCPSSLEYQELVRAIGVGVFFPGSAAVRRQVQATSTPPPAPPLSTVSWWDADTGTWQDTSATTAAVANNDPVARINDGNGTNNLTNTGGTDRPLLKTNVVNGHSAIQFDGSNDYLDKAFTWSGPSTLFAVIRIDTWTNTRWLFGPKSGDNYDVYMDTASPKIGSYFGSGASNNIDPGFVVGTFAIFCVRGTGAGTIRVNNGSALLGGTGDQVSNGLRWAAHSSGLFGAVSIARVEIYNTQLSTTDETTARNALNTRYACF